MSELYTVIELPVVLGEHKWNGQGLHGRKTRAEMIAEAKRDARRELDICARILAARDEEFIVKIVRGVHVQHLVENLKPSLVEELKP